MVACVLDMVMAGTETTAATLQWAALLMGKHPRVQSEPGARLRGALGAGGRGRGRSGAGPGSQRGGARGAGRGPGMLAVCLARRPCAGGAGPRAGARAAPAARGRARPALY